MGFELYLMSFAKGNPAGIDRAAVRVLFPVVGEESEHDHLRVRYTPTETCTIDVTPVSGDPSRVESVCIHRPCGDKRLFDAMFSLLRMGSVVLVFPGDAPPLVANESTVCDLPSDMVDSMGQPRCVHSAEEILQIIRNA